LESAEREREEVVKKLFEWFKLLFNLKNEDAEYEVRPVPTIENAWLSQKLRQENLASVLSLTLDRMWYSQLSTTGELRINGEFECYILEDYYRLSKGRKKKHGETAIPRGTYGIRITKSRKFKRRLPLLISVPGFSGIRIHAGNTAKDTEGCLLPGTTRSENFVGQSKRAFNKLFKKLERAQREGKKITIRIE